MSFVVSLTARYSSAHMCVSDNAAADCYKVSMVLVFTPVSFLRGWGRAWVWAQALSENGFAKVRTWNRRVNIFEVEKFLVPIHLPGHWVFSCINFRDKRVEFYDSMSGANGRRVCEVRGKASFSCVENLCPTFRVVLCGRYSPTHCGGSCVVRMCADSSRVFTSGACPPLQRHTF